MPHVPAGADQHAEAPVHLERGQVSRLAGNILAGKHLERGQVVRHLTQADHHTLLHIGAQLEAVLVTETKFSLSPWSLLIAFSAIITLEHPQIS